MAETHTPTAAATAGAVTSARAHLPALDGWRGLAVAAVIAFHIEVLPGGWLGVDLFFVLSGFLITRLLVGERRGTGTVSMAGFWARRAKRLLPALVVFFAGVAAYAAWYPDPISLPKNLAGELAASAGYIANWFQLSSSAEYWDTYSVASPLRHMWSLAIEEQFYIVFPVAAVALLRLTKDRAGATLALLAGGAVASWAAAAARLGVDGAAFERVYLGTDTRVAAVLIGAAAGYATVTPKVARHLEPVANRAAFPAAAAMVVGFFALDGTGAWPWARWGWVVAFELAACIVLVAAASTSRDQLAVNSAITAKPLLWLGGVSYGLYLWHFPLLLASERALVGSPRVLVVAVAVGAAAVIAQLSLKFVESPLRHGTRSRAEWVRVAALGAVVVVASGLWTWHSTAEARAHHAKRAHSDTPTADIVAAGADDRPLVPTTAAPVPDVESGAGPAEPARPASLLPLPTPEGRAPRVLLVGDSMVLDLADGLDAAAEGRATASHAAMIGCSAGGMDPTGSTDELGSDEQVRRCDEFRASWTELAATSAPDAMVIMRTSSRASGPATGGDGDMCSPGYRDWYAAQLRDEIAALEPHVGIVAYTSAVYNRFGGLVFPESDRITDCLNDITREVAEGHPRAEYLPLGEWVCPSLDGCISFAEIDLRPDGVHFSGRGAERASTWILDTLWGPSAR